MHPNCFRYYAEMGTAEKGEKAKMSKQQVVKELKDILLSNDLTIECENALIIAIAELLKG